MSNHIVQDELAVVHEEGEGYENEDHTKLNEIAAHMVAAAKSSDGAGEDYEMVDHHDAHHHHEAEAANGEVELDQEAYGEEHEYAEYDMAEVDMAQGVGGDQGTQAAEYAENMAGTDEGSILATQDNDGDEQLLDDSQQNGEYSYDQDMVDDGAKAQAIGIDEHGGELVDEHGHHQSEQQLDPRDQQVAHEAEHQHAVYEVQDDQGGQIYDSNSVSTAPIDYTIISTAAASSSLAELSQAISSSVGHLSTRLATSDQEAQQVVDGHSEQQLKQNHHDPKQIQGADGYAHQTLSHSEPHSLPHTHSPSPLSGNSSVAVSTPIGYKTASGLMHSPQNVTPAKRPHSGHKGTPSTNTRLKSKVWNWYDILPDGYRQCRFCPQKYGNLTATTILARHYHNRHEMDESASGTPSHRGSAATVRSSRNNSVHTPTHQQISLQQSNQSVYSQAAAAAAAVAAAAVTANGESAYAHSALAGNGTATEDLLRSVSEAVQNSPYEENQIIMQDGFQTMMTTPLTRISLTPARRAVAAVAQFCAQNDMQKNLQTCVDLVSTAARRGAKMVFLPEASDFIAETRMQPAQQAQGLDGQFMKEMQQAAKDNGIWISVGIHEQPPVNGMPYNTNAVISDDGSLVSIYRKLHLFDVNVKDGPRLSESSVTSRGEQIVDPVDTPVGRLGLSVCYDLRFPELAQRLRMRGAQLLCYPSAFTETTGAPHWEVLLRARAIETQTYVFAAAQVGKHNPKRSSYGDAMIVDPWGSVVARCSRNSSEPALATAEINLDFLDKVRRESPVFSHKRADVFSEYAS